MNPLTLEEIRIATNAKLVGANPPALIHTICTDTRDITPGCLFIAIKGENHDGHDYLQTAADKGAVTAMVDRAVNTTLPMIQVEDTRKAMGRLANHVRRQLKCKVIAVAGSNGKTGTKNLVHAALKNARTGTISPKSFNNDIGVPTTIFAASPDQDYLVLEIGTNHPGEILNLTTIAEPDIAIITNIGAEHLEFLGDLDGVTHENAQIIAGMNAQGLLVINGDCPDLSDLSCRDTGLRPVHESSENQGASASCETHTGRRPVSQMGDNHPTLVRAVETYPGRTITFGVDPTNDLQAHDISCRADGVYFCVKQQTPVLRYTEEPDASPARSGSSVYLRTGVISDQEIFIPLMGRHIAVNALSAIAVARYLGVTDADIFAGLATATGPEMRLQLQTAGSVKILNDAYNANPHSMRAGLETIRDMEHDGRKIAILGDMRELGPTADQYHRAIGTFAAACGLDHLVCVGEKSVLIAKAAIDAGMDAGLVERYSTAIDCAANISSIISDNDLVLLKASRGMKLESIAAAITTAAASAQLRRQIASRSRQVVRAIVTVDVSTSDSARRIP